MTTYYISPTGSDITGNGSNSTPWATLNKFLGSSISGDTLICTSGSYTFSNATITNRTIRGISTDSVIFDAGNSTASWATNSGTTNVHNIWFKNVISSGYSGVLYAIMGSAPIFTISNCRFSNTTLYSEMTYGGVVSLSGWGNGTSTISVYSCIFDNLNLTGSNFPVYFSMRDAGTGSIFRFYNNVFFLKTVPTVEPSALFGCWNQILTWEFKNNIFRNLTTPKYLSHSYVPVTLMSVYNNDLDGIYINGSPAQANNITSNPIFIDENNSNFRLKPTSPCINMGVSI